MTQSKPDIQSSSSALWNRSYILLFCINTLVSLSLYMTNPSMSGYLSGKGFTAAAIGAIIGALSITSMVTRPFSGFLCDRISLNTLLISCLCLNSVTLFGYCFFQHPSLFLLLRVLHGIAFSLSTTILMTYVTSYIPTNRTAQGMGYFALGQSIATAIGPSLGLTLSKYANGAMNFAAAGSILVLAIIAAFMLPRPAHSQNFSKTAVRLHWKSFIAPEAIPFAIITIALSSSNGIENAYIASYGQQLGFGNVGWYFTISVVTLFLSRLLLGNLSDKHSFSGILLLSSSAICIALLLLASAQQLPHPVLFIVASILKACAVGLLQPAIQAMTIQSVSPNRRGSATSTYYIGTDLGQGFSTLIAGALIPCVGYAGVFLVLVIPFLLVNLYYRLH